MPLDGEPLISGELESSENGVAHGWVQSGRHGPCLVIVRLDGVPAGAAASMVIDHESAPGTARSAFQVELDSSRIARGGLLTAECVAGTFRTLLAGQVTLAANGAAFTPPLSAENEADPFNKRAGLRVTGWLAAPNRCPAPVLSGMIDGRLVLQSGPSTFSPEAWRAGGQLASGYVITFPVNDGPDQTVDAVLRDDLSGREVWRGVFDASDRLHEDVRQITSRGACRLGNASQERLAARCDAFIREIETGPEARLNHEIAALALRLISWIRDTSGAESAFTAAMRLRPTTLARRLPGPFLDTLAALICALPRDTLEFVLGQLDATFASSPANRNVSLLKVLVRTRLTGLDDGGERIIRLLNSMNYSQSALNWIWEAVSHTDSAEVPVADLRQLIEFEIIARNVPFLNGYELRAAGP